VSDRGIIKSFRGWATTARQQLNSGQPAFPVSIRDFPRGITKPMTGYKSRLATTLYKGTR